MPHAMKYVADALQIVEEECGDASMHSCPHLILSANIHRDIGCTWKLQKRPRNIE